MQRKGIYWIDKFPAALNEKVPANRSGFRKKNIINRNKEKNVKKILITGASGFIGRAVCEKLSRSFSVVALIRGDVVLSSPCICIKGDILDEKEMARICNIYRFDAVIHCAGIAHQRPWKIGADAYRKVNSQAVKNLAFAAAKANPGVYFIFLSSISVYGEARKESNPITEEIVCRPSSEYAESKLEAEYHLKSLVKKGVIRKVDLLRLSPVYNRHNTFNIDKRVLCPGNLAYILIGTGKQKMSALALFNLVDFIEFRLKLMCLKENENKAFCDTFNVCDMYPYSFEEIIQIYRRSLYQPNRIVIRIPFFIVKFLIKVCANLMRKKRNWFLAAYNKLRFDLVFDNQNMLKTGFVHKYGLETVLLNRKMSN